MGCCMLLIFFSFCYFFFSLFIVVNLLKKKNGVNFTAVEVHRPIACISPHSFNQLPRTI